MTVTVNDTQMTDAYYIGTASTRKYLLLNSRGRVDTYINATFGFYIALK